MKRFLIALAVLVLATLLMVAGYLTGWFESDAPSGAIRVTLEEEDDDSRLLILLQPVAGQGPWAVETAHYRVQVARTGGDQYHFQVAWRLPQRTVRATTDVRLTPGDTQRVAEFGAGGSLRGRHQIVARLSGQSSR